MRRREICRKTRIAIALKERRSFIISADPDAIMAGRRRAGYDESKWEAAFSVRADGQPLWRNWPWAYIVSRITQAADIRWTVFPQNRTEALEQAPAPALLEKA